MLAAIEIIEANDRAEPGSLLHALHEEQRFDERAFWLYYKSIRQLAVRSSSRADNVDLRLARSIVRTSQYVLRSVVWHFLRGDSYRIQNLDTGRISAFLERLTSAVDGYFGGYVLDDAKFTDSLREPND